MPAVVARVQVHHYESRPPQVRTIAVNTVVSAAPNHESQGLPLLDPQTLANRRSNIRLVFSISRTEATKLVKRRESRESGVVSIHALIRRWKETQLSGRVETSLLLTDPVLSSNQGVEMAVH
jgi:hypothetical protein